MSENIKKSHANYLNKFLEKVNGFSEEEIKNCFLNMSTDEAEKLGFRRWNNTLYLFPKCFLDLIPIGMELISIFGEKIIYDGDNIDTDTRGGLLAYGIILERQMFV